MAGIRVESRIIGAIEWIYIGPVRGLNGALGELACKPGDLLLSLLDGMTF